MPSENYADAVIDLVFIGSAMCIGLLLFHAAGFSNLSGLLAGLAGGVWIVGRNREAMPDAE